LGWDLPHHVLEPYFEYLNWINGLWYGNMNLRMMGCGLTNAMAEFGLDGLSQQQKEDERTTFSLGPPIHLTVSVASSTIAART
jgi:hypothetical protein